MWFITANASGLNATRTLKLLHDKVWLKHLTFVVFSRKEYIPYMSLPVGLATGAQERRCTCCKQWRPGNWHHPAVAGIPHLRNAICKYCYLRFQKNAKRYSSEMFVDMSPCDLTTQAIAHRLASFHAVLRSSDNLYYIKSEWLRQDITGHCLQMLLGSLPFPPTSQEMCCLPKRAWENRIIQWRKALRLIRYLEIWIINSRRPFWLGRNKLVVQLNYM